MRQYSFFSRTLFVFFVAVCVFAVAAGLASALERTPPDSQPAGPGNKQAQKEKKNKPKVEKLPDGVVARINGKDVTKDEFWKFFLDFNAPGVMQQYITFRVLENKAKELGVSVTDEEIEKKVEETLKEQLKYTNGDMDQLLEQARRYTEAQLKAYMRLASRFRLLMERATKAYALTEPELKKRFKKHFQKDREYFRGGLITIPKNKGDLAKQIGADIAAGKISFANAAKQHSTDMNAKKGGDLDFFPSERFGNRKAILEQFRALKPGAVSPAFETKFAWHIVRLDAHFPAGTIQFKDVEQYLRDQIEKDGLFPKAQQDIMESWLAEADVAVDLK